MPRTTRSASKRKPTKRATTPEASGKSVEDSPSPSATSKRPKLGKSKSPEDGDTPRTPVQPSRIVGSRMSGVKHSGLLAKDQETRVCLDQDVMDSNLTSPQLGLNLPLNTNSNTLMDDQDIDKQSISGKQMYSFASKTQLGRKGLTPKPKLKETASSEIEITSTKKHSVTSIDDSKSVGATHSSDDEKMEVDSKNTNKQKATTSRRITRSSKKVISESDTDESEMSEDEELALLASKLNRGEAVGGVSENILEDYFTAHSGKAGLTSDHTLAKLACPKMDQQTVQSTLKETPSSYQEERQALLEEYKNLYPYWLHLMSNGYNILLYGLGSKLKLLEDFQTKHLSVSCHLVVNGFFPGLAIKQVLSTLSSDLLGYTGSFKSLLEHTSFICSELEGGNRSSSTTEKCSQKEVFLIIHNIDGPMLRGETAQTVLSLLAQSPSVHILASIDHINAPLCWDQRKLSKFNWLWHDVTTFEFYHDETSYENSLLVQQSGTLALSSLTHVTKSLTPNARGIFKLLVKYQLEHKSDSDNIYLGMSFHVCYVKCREKFLVNSDMTLRAQLTEFRDHKLVRSRKGQDGVEYLFIPIDNGTLSQFLEQKGD